MAQKHSSIFRFPLSTDKPVAKATLQTCELAHGAQQDQLPTLGKAAAQQGRLLSSLATRQILIFSLGPFPG